MLWQNAHSLIDPLIDSRGFYSWSFNPLFPVDVRFYTLDKCVSLRMNRHDYVEPEGCRTFGSLVPTWQLFTSGKGQ